MTIQMVIIIEVQYALDANTIRAPTKRKLSGWHREYLDALTVLFCEQD